MRASSPFFCNVALRPKRPNGLLWTGSPARPPRLSHSSQALGSWFFVFSAALRPQRPYGLVTDPGRPPRLSHRSWALTEKPFVQCCFTSTETVWTLTGEPRASTSSFTQLLSVSVCSPFVIIKPFKVHVSGPVLLDRVYSLISKPKENVRPR